MTYAELENKYPSPITYDGITYPSAENAFQATRFKDYSERRRFSYFAPYEAEYKGAKFRSTVPDWDNEKYDIMYNILKIKFSDPIFKKRLLDTGNQTIIIKNRNHEHEWGTCTCSRCRGAGNNNLGKLLMQLRSELREN